MIFEQDPYRRTFKKLRVSLTESCNLNCTYCTLENDIEINADHRPQLSAKKFISLISHLHKNLQLQHIRLTGGEPLLYRELPELLSGIKLLGIHEISMTTNGYLLDRKVEELKYYGLNNINISLDAIHEDVFFKITHRKNIDKIFSGIDKALSIGLQVKINAVIMKGINDQQIIPLLEYCSSKNITIRFLELMKMGHLHQSETNLFYSQHDILAQIATHYTLEALPRKKSATANYWQTNKGQIFGIIANESAPFCSDCSRIRLDSKGNIYGCLSNQTPIPINDLMNTEELKYQLNLAMQQKQLIKFTGSELSMLKIGG